MSVVSANIQIWRQRTADGTMTTEDYKAAIAAIRAERLGASSVSAAAKERTATAKRKAAPVNTDDLLKELGL